jgi:hypothetical protein
VQCPLHLQGKCSEPGAHLPLSRRIREALMLRCNISGAIRPGRVSAVSRTHRRGHHLHIHHVKKPSRGKYLGSKYIHVI